MLANFQLNEESDIWHYRWNSDTYSSMKAYKILISGPPAHSLFQNIWKSAAILRYKIFLWLLLHDRLNTRNLLSRKSFHLPSYSCILCSENVEETSLHLFFDCSFSRECWDSILIGKRRGISVLDECCLTKEVLPKNIATDILIMGS